MNKALVAMAVIVTFIFVVPSVALAQNQQDSRLGQYKGDIKATSRDHSITHITLTVGKLEGEAIEGTVGIGRDTIAFKSRLKGDTFSVRDDYLSFEFQKDGRVLCFYRLARSSGFLLRTTGD